MTDTDTKTASAELEPVIAGALALLEAKPGTSLEDLAAAVAAELPPPLASAEAQKFPKLPRKITLTEDAQNALNQIAGMFNSVELAHRRALTEKERELLTAEMAVIGQIAKVLGPRADAIKEYFRVHMDVSAEEAGIAIDHAVIDPASGEVVVPATPRDQNGHYLLAGPQEPNQVIVKDVAWSQEYSCAAPKPSATLLKEAYEAGEIDQKTYNAVTVPVRSFDQGKFLVYLRRQPREALALLRRISRRGKPQSALYLREVK